MLMFMLRATLLVVPAQAKQTERVSTTPILPFDLFLLQPQFHNLNFNLHLPVYPRCEIEFSLQFELDRSLCYHAVLPLKSLSGPAKDV